MIVPVKLRLATLTLFVLLGACRSSGDLTSESGGGVYQVRNPCPIAGVPTGTGDITLFSPAGSTDSRAIDVTAAITNLRATCQTTDTDHISTATFDVVARRSDPVAARQVVLPYFDVALQGGEKVVAKQIGSIVLDFPAGHARTSTRAQATIRVNRAASTIPEEARRALTRERKAGDADAAVDPLSDPAIRSAVAGATFEHLIGFQLTPDQLRYNATR